MDELFNLSLGSSVVHSTTDPAPVLHIFYIPLQTQYRSPYTPQSTTDTAPVLRILDTPLQSRYRSSNSLNTRHQTYVCFPVQYRPSTSPAYTMQSTTDPVLVIRIQSPTDPVPVLSEILSPLKTQPRVYSIGHYIPSTSTPYTIFSKDLVPVLLTNTSPPYTLQSTTGTEPVPCILYNPLETQYQSIFSTVHYRSSCSSVYTLQSTSDTVPVLRTIHYRPSTSLPYTLQSTTNIVPVFHIFYSLLQNQYQASVYTVHYRPSSSPLYTQQ